MQYQSNLNTIYYNNGFPDPANYSFVNMDPSMKNRGSFDPYR